MTMDKPQERIDLAAKSFLILSLFFMPISTAATNIFMGLTLIAWLLSGGFRLRLESLRGNQFVYATVALVILVCIGGTYSTGSPEDIGYQIHKYAKLLMMLPAITLLQEDKWRQRGLAAFTAAMLLTLGLSLLSVVWPLPFVRGTENGPSNNHFVFRDHIAQNLMMSFFVLVMAVRARFHSSSGKRLLYWALALLSIIDILFFVLGRTGYVSLALNAIVFWFFLESARQRIAVAIIVALIAIMTLQLSSGFRNRIDLAIQEYQEHEKKELSSVGQRIEFVKKGMRLIMERPVTGFGTGSYKTEFCRVADSPEWCTAGGFHPHNQFIAFGVQLGAIGILGYLLFLGVCVKQALTLPTSEKIMGVGLVATLLADSIFHAPLFLISEAAFFILLLPIFMARGSLLSKPGSQVTG